MRQPVLLLGAGTGEATCGILYLASYLRRHDVEAFVRLTDDDETPKVMERSLRELIAHVKPRLIGISLKWFHHVARARLMARLIRKIDPTISIVLGGNTATYFCNELLAWDCVDHVILGDGEAPLLALCRGVADAPNVMSRGVAKGRATLGYVQSTKSDDVYYSHFDQLFLSQLDLASFSGWVAPGKGCGENCLYCGGTRGMQKATFGRATPFLRPMAAVQRDHQEIASRTWQLRYDFAGSTSAFLSESWKGVDLSRHAATYFLWGVPPTGLMETLSGAFERVFMVLDIGCFSEVQRLEQLERGLLKPCPTDDALMRIIEASKGFENLELEISGIAGLPFATRDTLRQEQALVERVLGTGCMVGYQRLEAQPGALVTEHPERFGMRTEARTFDEFLQYFEALEPDEKTVPMVRYLDDALEDAVQATSDAVDARVWEHAEKVQHVEVTKRTRLVNASASTRELSLQDWLGAHRVPQRVAKERVTAVRSTTGVGLACVPTLSRRVFSDAALHQEEDGAALLAVLDAFSKPTTVERALQQLQRAARMDSATALEVVEHLVAGRFLKPA